MVIMLDDLLLNSWLKFKTNLTQPDKAVFVMWKWASFITVEEYVVNSSPRQPTNVYFILELD